MYKHFFGLRESPFNVNPDPRYLFLTPQTREALDELTYGIGARKGLILLTGEVGTGKTTLINRLLDWLRQQRTPTAFIFNSHLEVSHLFDFILADFGVPPDSRRGGNALMRLNQWLLERHRASETPVLIVDEAQGLPNYVLEELRMLLNLETSREKLLQIVLAGQPELEERLERLELRQIKQRIALRCKTAPLTLEETHDYIRARLDIAGANARPIFASEAMDAVHFYSRGIPRVMNLLCEHALISAYVDSIELVPARIIADVAREFQFDHVKPVGPPVVSPDVLDSHSIAAQSAFWSELLSPPAKAEHPAKGILGALAIGASAPFIVAKRGASPASESVVGPLALETIPTLREVTVAAGQSSCQVVASPGPESRPFESTKPPETTPAAPATAADRKSAVGAIAVMRSFILTAIIALRVFVLRWSARSRDFLSSTIDSLARSRKPAILYRRLEGSLESVSAWARRSLRRRNNHFSFDWRGITLSIARWLQQPWKPSGHFPGSRLFDARSRFSYKKT